MHDVQAPPAGQPFSDDVAALAAAEGLGGLRASFAPKRRSAWSILGLAVFGLFGLFVFVLPGLFFLWQLWQTPNVNRRQAARRIHCFEHGLVLDEPGGPLAFRWDALSVLQRITRRYVNGIYVGTSYEYRLFRPDGVKARLTGFYADPEVWGAAVQHEITRAQLPGVLGLLGGGGTVHFGDMVVNAAGVATANRNGVPWGEVEQVEVRRGTVAVRRAGKWLPWSNTPVHKIPNFFLFLCVVEELRARNGAL
ncbi:hypothetical protein Kpho02_08770 [Kitasatospora phosalacinea]|uniref:Uncharacterized protein n=1 Tax=Kitasatospora phosalacinea TaxID=2065 RepID=A0A9W6Q4W2_9ACTN|nr:DUF6585 family protein [Kitasatospora phosalacinea]GLW68578.1 hypothetical protein Kpho02_08770 [Kitasatospora phosalacinea]